MPIIVADVKSGTHITSADYSRESAAVADNPGSQSLHVLILLKTNEGGLWIRGQVAELLARDHRVTLMVPAGPGKLKRHLSSFDISIVDSPFEFSFKPYPSTFRGLWRLRRAIREINPDVVFYHLYASALAARLSTLFTGIPRVHMVAGPLYLESSLIARIEGVIRGLDTALISGSEYTYSEYEKLTGPRPGTHVAIAYGVDSDKYSVRSEDKPVLRQRLGWQPDHFSAVMVAYTYAPKDILGQEVGVKGHELLLQAWQKFIDRLAAESAGQPKTSLYIVGSGFDDAGEQHRQKLMANNVPGVVWVDTVSAVGEYYHAADVSVSPSLSENHGAAMEAGAFGCPQIVSTAGGLPEMVTSESGWVFPSLDVDALADTLHESYREWCANGLDSRGEKARAHIAAGYDIKTCAVQVVDVIEGVARR